MILSWKAPVDYHDKLTGSYDKEGGSYETAGSNFDYLALLQGLRIRSVWTGPRAFRLHPGKAPEA